MASEVDICNLSLSHLGDDAEVASISPPDGSVQALHCARFYPIARDEILELHDWSFARTRKTGLAQVTSAASSWAFAFVKPANIIIVRQALPEGYTDDELDGLTFKEEGDLVYCNSPIDTLICTNRITDTTKFSPLFVVAFGWQLAGYIAGPIRKETDGKMQTVMFNKAMRSISGAAASNANIDNTETEHRVPWLAGR